MREQTKKIIFPLTKILSFMSDGLYMILVQQVFKQVDCSGYATEDGILYSDYLTTCDANGDCQPMVCFEGEHLWWAP